MTLWLTIHPVVLF